MNRPDRTAAAANSLDQALADLLGAAPVRLVSAYLFGSHAEGRAHRESDVDVGILLPYAPASTPKGRFEARISVLSFLISKLGQNANAVDVIVLNDAPPLLGRRIVTHGRRVLCTDPEADHAFVRDVQLRAADLEPFLRRSRQVKLASITR
jgi:predicted nucleotidyltransferase